MHARLANAIGYQLVWFCAVAGAGRGWGWCGPLAAAVFSVATLVGSRQRAQDLRLLIGCLALGAAVDGAYAASGWLHYAQPWPWPGVAPPWILAIWAGFSLTLHRSLAYLLDRPWLAALLGLFGGPLAYSAARGFGAVQFGAAPGQVFLALAITWTLAVPALFWLARQTPFRSTRSAVA